MAGDAGDMRRDSTESMAPVHGDSDFSRMDSVASVAPTGRRDSNIEEGMPYSVFCNSLLTGHKNLPFSLMMWG